MVVFEWKKCRFGKELKGMFVLFLVCMVFRVLKGLGSEVSGSFFGEDLVIKA